jgi:hypothetical protein
MKIKLIAGMLTVVVASSVYADAPQRPPSDNEGTELSPAIAKRLNLPSGCRVALPDPKGNQARVARTAARMSAWVASQAPEKKDPPRVYLHREGDRHVFLRGPAIEPVNMGELDHVAIMQRENSMIPIGIVDHTDEVHWVSLSNIGTVKDRLKEYKDGLGDAGMIEKMSFKVRNARPTKKPFQKVHDNNDSYTVTALIINFLGQPRVFGICM